PIPKQDDVLIFLLIDLCRLLSGCPLR
ncbi:MAG: hypothetical protein JWN70_4716, partial [Planctomycetaceae bacterium]|nr:hypothetical protein [Planctomycetaceae bacterium]